MVLGLGRGGVPFRGRDASSQAAVYGLENVPDGDTVTAALGVDVNGPWQVLALDAHERTGRVDGGRGKVSWGEARV